MYAQNQYQSHFIFIIIELPWPHTAVDKEILAHESADYHRVYEASLEYPEVFWVKLAKKLLKWREDAFESINSCDLSSGHVEWFSGGTLNVNGNKHILPLHNTLNENTINYMYVNMQGCLMFMLLSFYRVLFGSLRGKQKHM